MDLGNPVGDVAPGIRGRLLATLAQLEAPVTAAALARHAGVSPQACLPHINDMSEAGLVTAEWAGRARMVALNRQHLLAGPLLALASTRRRLVEQLANELVSWPDLAAAWLFGFAARGDGDRRSDIDLLLVADSDTESARWIDASAKLAAQVRGWTGNHPQLVEHTRQSFKRLAKSSSPLLASIRSDAIALTPESPALLRAVT